ncbi:MAG: hypothetical protein OEY49_20195, partial [Candidatus Heimdallarchaeota archaeon]|nr:hypothetical protein [Candidatus Heimdallarchaeota archaeon]
MGKVDYLELLLNREWEKLYDTTKNRLDNHTAKAFYVTSISGIIGNEEIPNDETAYEIFMNMKDDFEKQKETHPMEYGIFLCRLANFTDESCEKENLFDKGLSYLKPQNNLLYSYYLLPLSLIYQINGDLEKCIALQEEAYHTFKHYKYQLKYQILSNLSWSFHLLRQYDKAISYSKLSIDNLEEKSKILQYHLLFGYCVIHCYAGRRDEVEP